MNFNYLKQRDLDLGRFILQMNASERPKTALQIGGGLIDSKMLCEKLIYRQQILCIHCESAKGESHSNIEKILKRIVSYIPSKRLLRFAILDLKPHNYLLQSITKAMFSPNFIYVLHLSAPKKNSDPFP